MRFPGPSRSIVRFALPRSRRSASLRPRCARLSALTAPAANLRSQLSTARREGLDDAGRRRYSRFLIVGCCTQPSSTSPDVKQTNRRPQVTIRFSLMIHFLVVPLPRPFACQCDVFGAALCAASEERVVNRIDVQHGQAYHDRTAKSTTRTARTNRQVCSPGYQWPDRSSLAHSRPHACASGCA